MKAEPTKKLPKKIFVREEQDGDESYLVAEREPNTGGEDSAPIGVYVLQEVGTVRERKPLYRRSRFVR